MADIGINVFLRVMLVIAVSFCCELTKWCIVHLLHYFILWMELVAILHKIETAANKQYDGQTECISSDLDWLPGQAHAILGLTYIENSATVFHSNC